MIEGKWLFSKLMYDFTCSQIKRHNFIEIAIVIHDLSGVFVGSCTDYSVMQEGEMNHLHLFLLGHKHILELWVNQGLELLNESRPLCVLSIYGLGELLVYPHHINCSEW